MSINKAFVVKNGFEVSTDLILANADTRRVGIAITNPRYTLDVAGGIGATDFYLVGVGTFVNELNVGLGGTVLTVLGIGNSIGIGTALPAYLLDIRSPVSTGQTALYVQGDVRITGDLIVDDITFDDATIQNLTVTEALNVTSPGISTLGGYVDINNSVDISSNLNVVGLTTLGGYVDINANADFSGTINVVGLSTLGGYVDINNSVDISTNLNVVGLSTLGGYVDINNSVDISNNLNVSGIATIASVSIVGAALSNLIVTGIATIATVDINGGDIEVSNVDTAHLNVTGISTLGTVRISSGIITATSGIVTYFGDGSNLTGLTGNPTLQTVLNTGNTSTIGMSISGVTTFTNGPVLIGTVTSTGTASQPLQVTGGAYVSGSVGIGTTNPGATLNVVPTETSIAGLFSGTTSSDMVRITQLGSGNALVVEDSTNPDSSPFVVKADGSVGIGTTDPAGTTHLDVYRSNASIQARNISTTSQSRVYASDADYFTSFKSVFISKVGTGATGNIFSSIPNADLGALSFQNTTNALIYTNGGTPLIFGTLSTEAMRIDSSQRVGIGTTNPTSKLHVVGDVRVIGVVTASAFFGDGSGLTGAGSTVFNDTTTNQEFFPLFTATTSGTITASGISTSKLTYNPSSGEVTAVDFNSTSDFNLKTNIHTVNNALETINALRGVSFDWKETGKGSYGVIAQELEEVLPELVKGNDPKTVSYSGIIGILIEAVKELKVEVEDLKRHK